MEQTRVQTLSCSKLSPPTSYRHRGGYGGIKSRAGLGHKHAGTAKFGAISWCPGRYTEMTEAALVYSRLGKGLQVSFSGNTLGELSLCRDTRAALF
jgi:hypothetical protein